MVVSNAQADCWRLLRSDHGSLSRSVARRAESGQNGFKVVLDAMTVDHEFLYLVHRRDDRRVVLAAELGAELRKAGAQAVATQIQVAT